MVFDSGNSGLGQLSEEGDGHEEEKLGLVSGKQRKVEAWQWQPVRRCRG